ncbi:YxiJ family protein [Lysinibacillus sp. NPDC097287]|uniref:YxiJ family protein n=1 Tax=Lysinibacillus sp. NPDC097287 TaxID=3364144 RepID=UPI00381EAEE7
MNDNLKQLTEIESKLKKPFPTSDINKICADFRTEFLNLSDEFEPYEVDFYEDFRYYCVNIAGTLSYVLGDKTNQIPQGQIDMLYKSFFEYYNQYEFLEDQIANYNHFFQKYKSYEQARNLLLQLLSSNYYPLNRQSLYTKINLNF